MLVSGCPRCGGEVEVERRRTDRMVGQECVARLVEIEACVACGEVVSSSEVLRLEERIVRHMLSPDYDGVFGGAELRRCRQAFGLSKRQLGELTGLSTRAVTAWEAEEVLPREVLDVVREAIVRMR